MRSYCTRCNQPMEREYMMGLGDRNGRPIPLYFDRTHRFPITHCDGCGQRLRERILSNHPDSTRGEPA